MPSEFAVAKILILYIFEYRIRNIKICSLVFRLHNDDHFEEEKYYVFFGTGRSTIGGSAGYFQPRFVLFLRP